MSENLDIVKQVVNGDKDAFRLLVERYNRPVISMIRNIVGDYAAAEDIAQDVFVAAYKKLSSFDPARSMSYYELNNGARYKILVTAPKKPKDFGPITVPKYSCFVFGDNRNMSRDSRAFGSLQVAAIRGKFEYLYFTTGDKSRLGNINK